jgi:hypothetical protein
MYLPFSLSPFLSISLSLYLHFLYLPFSLDPFLSISLSLYLSLNYLYLSPFLSISLNYLYLSPFLSCCFFRFLCRSHYIFYLFLPLSVPEFFIFLLLILSQLFLSFSHSLLTLPIYLPFSLAVSLDFCLDLRSVYIFHLFFSLSLSPNYLLFS